MKKVVLFVLAAVLLCIASYSADTNQVMPSQITSWILSAQDGTWTIKALGMASGQQGQEVLSIVTNPSGYVMDSMTASIDKDCGGCFSVGKMLVDPVSGATGVGIQELSKSNKDLAQALTEITSIQSFMSQNNMKDGQVRLVQGSKPGEYYVDQMTPANFGDKPIPEAIKNVMDVDGIRNVKVQVDNGKVLLEHLPSPEQTTERVASIESVAKSEATPSQPAEKIKKFETKIGDFKPGTNIEMSDMKGFDEKMVTKASIITKEGQKYVINGGGELVASEGSTINVNKLECNGNDCTTYVTVDTATRTIPGGFQGEVVNEPVNLKFCGNDITVDSGAKLNFEMKYDGEKSSCVAKKVDFTYSNKFGGNQAIKFDNVWFTLDKEKYDSQQGYVNFDSDKGILEGTFKNLGFKDGTKLEVAGETERKSQVTDKIEVELDKDGNVKKITSEVKNRGIRFTSKPDANDERVVVSDLISKDTFFRVKPLTITATKTGCYNIDPGIDSIFTECYPKPKTPETHPIQISDKLSSNGLTDNSFKSTAPPGSNIIITVSDLQTWSEQGPLDYIKYPPDERHVDGPIQELYFWQNPDFPLSIHNTLPPIPSVISESVVEPEKVLTQEEISKIIDDYFFKNYIEKQPVGLSDDAWKKLRDEYFKENPERKTSVTPDTLTKPSETGKSFIEQKAEQEKANQKLPEVTPARPLSSQRSTRGVTPATIEPIVPTEGKVLRQAMFLGAVPTPYYYEYQTKNDQTDSGSRYYTYYIDRNSAMDITVVKEPVDNIGVFFSQVNEGGTLYVYRRDTSGKLVEYPVVKKTIWEGNNGIEGVLVNQKTGKFFSVQKGDIIKTKK